MKLKLLQEGWQIKPRQQNDGPAVEFVHRDFLGSVGIIAPYSSSFCESCNRLRVSSKGGLRMCLFGEKDHSLRSYLKHADQRDELVAKIRSLIIDKDEHHHLNDYRYGMTGTLSSIGG